MEKKTFIFNAKNLKREFNRIKDFTEKEIDYIYSENVAFDFTGCGVVNLIATNGVSIAKTSLKINSGSDADFTGQVVVPFDVLNAALASCKLSQKTEIKFEFDDDEIYFNVVNRLYENVFIKAKRRKFMFGREGEGNIFFSRAISKFFFDFRNYDVEVYDEDKLKKFRDIIATTKSKSLNFVKSEEYKNSFEASFLGSPEKIYMFFDVEKQPKKTSFDYFYSIERLKKALSKAADGVCVRLLLSTYKQNILLMFDNGFHFTTAYKLPDKKELDR